MAQIIPPITSLPIDSGAAPSVEDIQDRLPSICVDYLSHNWTEEDVWVSWRNMTRHKHEIANGVRLENASWRTWNKQRNKLRTISPETLNWLKDSDVTWLYGPLHTANVEPVRPLKISSTQDRLGIDRPTGTKPGILKHRTLSELLAIPAPNAGGEDDLEEDDEAPAIIPPLPYTKSDSNLARRKSLTRVGRSPGATKRSGGSKERSPDTPHTSNKRHISFNTFVEQVIALDQPIIRRLSDDSDSDDVLQMRSRRGAYSNSSRSSTSTSSTIAKIAPGMLKTSGSYTNNPSLPKLVYMPTPEYRSPAAEVPPALQSTFGRVPVVTQSARQWNQDADYSQSADYFGGPDLTGSPASSASSTSHGRAPAVQIPPPQPKWRQQSDSGSSSNNSSSASLNGLITQQQPARSILKVRPVTNQPVSPEPVSPPALFNYNPSVATGIGGMFGGYDGAAQAGISIAPPASTGDREERGRSTSRGNGSSQYDRSMLRGTSVSSSSSSLQSVSRSPVETSSVKTVTPPSLDNVQEGATWESEPMDVDDSPDRSSTPTPHSSPQIVLRPLKDTSPASLPHTAALPSELRASVPNSPATGSPAEPPNGSQDDDDGSTLIGRATNIANTAKDLLGALWYGAQDETVRPRQHTPRRG